MTSRFPAHTGSRARCSPKVEPFPTKELVAYDTAYLSGFVVEHYQIVLLEAAKASEDAMRQKLEELCAAEVPGDTHRNLVIHPTFSAQTFKHILVPVWLLTYTYGARTFHVLVNGATGRIAGEYPKSFWKVFFLVVGIIIFVLRSCCRRESSRTGIGDRNEGRDV